MRNITEQPRGVIKTVYRVCAFLAVGEARRSVSPHILTQGILRSCFWIYKSVKMGDKRNQTDKI